MCRQMPEPCNCSRYRPQHPGDGNGPGGYVGGGQRQSPSHPSGKQPGTAGEPDYDPFCDPDSPKEVTFEDISAAAYRIKSGVIKTPCVPSHVVYEKMKIYLKCEFMQVTGSFKERGARNALIQLDDNAKKVGAIAASLGNHSQGMSINGKTLNIPITVVMPVVAPIMKISKCKMYGANVVTYGLTMKEAKYKAIIMGKEKGLAFINGYDHPAIIAGQGTVGLEILEQVPDVEAILVPCGGGGLLAGIAIAVKRLKPTCLVYGVETDHCASMAEALKAGKCTTTDVSSTLADGLAVGTPGVNSFLNVKKYVDKVVTVSEDATARSILRMVELEKFVVEGAGAVANAAIMSGLVPELHGKIVVCVLSGGNIDTTLLSRCLDRGLVAEERLVKFKVNISERPGSVGDLCKLIGNLGVPVKDISQERAWIRGNIFTVRVKVVCETQGPEQMEKLREVITKEYKECYFPKRKGDPGKRRSSLTDSLEKFVAK